MKLPTNIHYTRGFTLIELLVVIAIIGLLASIVLTSLSSARVKARDTQRVAAIVQIRNALELYAGDTTHYPNSNGTWVSFDAPTYSSNPIVSPAAATLTAALSKYFGIAPADPKPLGGDAGYLYIGDPNNYCILIYNTPENLNNFNRSLITRCSVWNANGVCTSSGGNNAIYYGIGTYSGGC